MDKPRMTYSWHYYIDSEGKIMQNSQKEVYANQIEAREKPCEGCFGSVLQSKYLGENDRWLCEECWTTEHVDMIDTAYANTYKETRIE